MTKIEFYTGSSPTARRRVLLPCALLITALWMGSLPVFAQTSYSPNVDQIYPTNVYFGDTHLHTNLSIDAVDTYNPMGKGLSPDDAYRFARGAVVTAHNGMKFRRQRPLDFLVIADHAENIGLLPALLADDPLLMTTEQGRELRARYESAKGSNDALLKLFFEIYRDYNFFGEQIKDKAFRRSVWNTITTYADQYNEPGKFTAFIGYEWSSFNYNLHRVVLFKDDAKLTRAFLPYSFYDSAAPEALWAYLAKYEQTTGGGALAIPHNGNLSEGQMFLPQDSEGKPATAGYAKNRARWEPLYEATQIKGDSETHSSLSPADEFADYETFTFRRETSRRQYEYARSALKPP